MCVHVRGKTFFARYVIMNSFLLGAGLLVVLASCAHEQSRFSKCTEEQIEIAAENWDDYPSEDIPDFTSQRRLHDSIMGCKSGEL